MAQLARGPRLREVAYGKEKLMRLVDDQGRHCFNVAFSGGGVTVTSLAMISNVTFRLTESETAQLRDFLRLCRSKMAEKYQYTAPCIRFHREDSLIDFGLYKDCFYIAIKRDISEPVVQIIAADLPRRAAALLCNFMEVPDQSLVEAPLTPFFGLQQDTFSLA